jgi:hypothetical protein
MPAREDTTLLEGEDDMDMIGRRGKAAGSLHGKGATT